MRLGWCGGGQPVGEAQKRPFQLSFNSSLRVESQGARVTSDGGLILVRELDERLGLSELMERHLTDSRRGKNTQLPLADLGRRKKCLRNRSEKAHLRALVPIQMRKRPLPVPLGIPWTNTGRNPCRERSSGLYRSCNRKVKTEIPDKRRRTNG